MHQGGRNDITYNFYVGKYLRHANLVEQGKHA